MLKQYSDLLANVRYDRNYHSVRSLVQPNDPIIQKLADILIQKGDFVANCQKLVDNYTKYIDEIGDYWAVPAELIDFQFGDCDCKAILLCSLLRNYIAADQVYCAVGIWEHEGKKGGHMWVMVDINNSGPRIIEATAPPDRMVTGRYTVMALFNDQYALASDEGIKEFDFVPVPLGTGVPARAMQ